MSVDVDIYMNNIQKFFKENPNDLLNLIPKEKESLFYDKVRETAHINFEKNGEASLTRNQLLDICRELNLKKVDVKKIPDVIIMTPFGGFSLN